MAHPDEPHAGGRLADRLNGLRAAVLGANDGIVSVAAVTVGVAGATAEPGPILTAGLAALCGGAISMALGEYISVSSQRDTERSLIAKERRELAEMPEDELAELTQLYIDRGLSAQTAHQVAVELTANDALAAHLAVELNIDQNDIVNPWRAAFSSAGAFLIGGLLPLLATVLIPNPLRIPLAVVVVLIALAIAGAVAARLGRAPSGRAVLRIVVGGAIALGVTYGLGHLLEATGIPG